MKKLLLASFIIYGFLSCFGQEVLVNKIAITVNGEPITLFDIKKQVNPQNPELVTLAQIQASKGTSFDRIINEILVNQEIKSRNITVSDDDVVKAIENVAAQNKITVDALKAEIEKQGVNWDTYKNEILKKQLQMLSLKRDIAISNLDVDEASLRILYDKEFKDEKVYTASHIILKSENENQESEVYAKIDEIYKSLTSAEQTIPFDEAAKTYSQDASAQTGGSLGTFSLRQMVPEFADKLKALKEGEISKPFKTRFGWHIARLEKIEKKEAPKYEEVKNQLRNIYYQNNQEKAFDGWLKVKKESSKIEILF